VDALPAGTGAAIIGVGDQPFLAPEIIRRLVSAFRASGAALVVPRYAGRRGNPVLFSAKLFPELLEVEGDQGGRPVLLRHRDEIVWVDVDEARAGLDIDTPEDYLALKGGQPAEPVDSS
jgi:molybdenum cofactor cytidylyltransferase